MFPRLFLSQSPASQDSFVPKKPTRSSMVYSSFRALVQKRFPVPLIPSSGSDLSIDMYGEAATSGTSGQTTPPPEYSSRPHSRHVSTIEASCALTESEGAGASHTARKHATLPTTRRSSGRDFDTGEEGIKWRFASQGASLYALAAESDTLVTTRRVYVDAVSYFLRGLHADLTEDELATLRSALPVSMQESRCHEIDALPTSDLQQPFILPQPGQDGSILQRTTAAVVFHILILIQFLLPYIKLCIAHAYRFECEHRITQRMFNRTIKTVDDLGRSGVQLSRALYQMDDGKVGQAVHNVIVWWVQGVTRGIQQGITEGLSVSEERERLRGPSPEGRIKMVD